MDQITKRYSELISLISRYNEEYYINNSPSISDYDYDMLYHELRSLEDKYPELVAINSPTKLVGGISKSAKKVTHDVRLYSLDNSYSKSDIINFLDRIKRLVTDKISFTVEPKIDGAAVSIIYNNGELVQAVTRGDGIIGEDITDVAMTITSLPKKIEDSSMLTLRGEIYMPITIFDKLNMQRDYDELPLFANPRNAASGSLKLLDIDEVRRRSLSIFFYGVESGRRFQTHYDDLLYIKSLGFIVNDNIFYADDIDTIMSSVDKIESLRSSIDYDIDGAVIKVNEYAIRSLLGFTSKYPRFAISYKYIATEVRTKLLAVTYQVGRTGAITPVAELSPILLSGSTVRRASLHNDDEILRLGVMIGDTVLIEKGGEIIPKVTKVDLSLRDSRAEQIISPSSCPICGTALIRGADDAKSYCINKLCPAIIIGSIVHFSSRSAMDIKGLGDKAIEEFYHANFLKTYADIYDLRADMILGRDGWKEQSVDNLIKAISTSKTKPFNKVLYSLGIRYVGATVADIIATHFKDIDTLIDSSYDDIISIYGIGDAVARSITEFFKDDDNIKLIDRLKSSGLNFKLDTSLIMANRLNSKTFLITGKLDMGRKDYEDLIISNGGKVLSSVTKSLDYLLVGDDAGSKLDKAKQLSIKIITAKEFHSMIKP